MAILGGLVGQGCGMVLHGLKGLRLWFSLAKGERELRNDSRVGLWVPGPRGKVVKGWCLSDE